MIREWLRNRGIEAVEFDLDDTLLDTYPFVILHMRSFLNLALARAASRGASIIVDEAWGAMVQINDSLYSSMAVSKEKWGVVAKKLDERYGLDVFTEQAGELMRIYEEVPQLLPGALDVLQFFRETGVRMGLVTHADERWTGLKMKKHDLERFFDHVEIVSDKKHKDSEDWLKGFRGLGVNPERGIVLGDSLSGDIIAAAHIGVKYRMWIRPKWKVFGVGEVPEQTVRLKSVDRVVPWFLALGRRNVSGW